MTSTHTKIDSKGINHSPSSVHFTAVLKSPEQLGPPRCIGPVYPRLRVLSALPFHGQFARREENPTGHLRYVSTRSEKHINTNMSSTGRQTLIWAHLSCHRYLPVQQKLLFNAPLVLNSLKSVHETLSQERQKLQAVWDANNMHQSNTLAQVRFVIWTRWHTLSCFFILGGWFSLFIPFFSSSDTSLRQWGVHPKDLHRWQTRLQNILMPVMTSCGAAPLRCLMNPD